MLLRLILNLLAIIAITEIYFSIMKIIKIRLWDKIKFEFLANNMIIYIETKSENFNSYSIIDEFNPLDV